MFKSGFESSASVGLGIKKLSTFWSNFALNAFEKKKSKSLFLKTEFKRIFLM